MPDVDRNARERLARKIGDPALHEHPLAGKICRDIGSMRHLLVFADIERTEYGGLGRAFALAMVDRIDQHRNPEHVREQDELLAGRRAFLADAGQDRKSTRLNSSHANISYAVFCLKKKKKENSHS